MIELLNPMYCGGVLRKCGERVALEPEVERLAVRYGNARCLDAPVQPPEPPAPDGGVEPPEPEKLEGLPAEDPDAAESIPPAPPEPDQMMFGRLAGGSDDL